MGGCSDIHTKSKKRADAIQEIAMATALSDREVRATRYVMATRTTSRTYQELVDIKLAKKEAEMNSYTVYSYLVDLMNAGVSIDFAVNQSASASAFFHILHDHLESLRALSLGGVIRNRSAEPTMPPQMKGRLDIIQLLPWLMSVDKERDGTVIYVSSAPLHVSYKGSDPYPSGSVYIKAETPPHKSYKTTTDSIGSMIRAVGAMATDTIRPRLYLKTVSNSVDENIAVYLDVRTTWEVIGSQQHAHTANHTTIKGEKPMYILDISSKYSTDETHRAGMMDIRVGDLVRELNRLSLWYYKRLIEHNASDDSYPYSIIWATVVRETSIVTLQVPAITFQMVDGEYIRLADPSVDDKRRIVGRYSTEELVPILMHWVCNVLEADSEVELELEDGLWIVYSTPDDICEVCGGAADDWITL